MELDPARLRVLFEEAAELGLREIVVGGGGEPLCRWTELLPLLEQWKRDGRSGLLFTNGTLIDRDAAAALTKMQWDKVLVSLDGLGEVNDALRGPGTFEKIAAGLTTLVEARGVRDYPIIGAGCVLTRENYQQIPGVVEFLAQVGCEQLNLIRFVPYAVDMQDGVLTEADVASLHDVLAQSKSLADSLGLVTNFEIYMDESLVKSALSLNELATAGGDSGKDGFWNALCFEPFVNIVIHPNGDAGPCCMSGDAPSASVTNRSLRDIWYGPEFAAIREEVLARRPLEYCWRCDLNVRDDTGRLRQKGQACD